MKYLVNHGVDVKSEAGTDALATASLNRRLNVVESLVTADIDLVAQTDCLAVILIPHDDENHGSKALKVSLMLVIFTTEYVPRRLRIFCNRQGHLC